MLLNVDYVGFVKFVFWFSSLSGIDFGIEEGEFVLKKSGWVFMGVWGLCYEFFLSLVLGRIFRGVFEEVGFVRVGK